VFYFDEFIELNFPQTNVAVSPYSPKMPSARVLGKKVIFTFEEGLKANTTYSIHLTNAIKDNNEGNLLPNYNLTFSTGKYLDTGKLIFGLSDAKTNAWSDMAKVCLVKTKSDFFGKNYRYVSPSKDGLAQFSNLANESFYVFTFIDSNMNMIWDKTESIGFIKEPVKAGRVLSKIKLFQQSQKKTNFFVTPISSSEFNISASEDIYFPGLTDPEHVLLNLSPRQLKLIVKTTPQINSLRLKYNLDKYETIELPVGKPSLYLDLLLNTAERSSKLVRPDTVKIPFNAFISKIDTNKIKLKIGENQVKPNVQFQKNNLLIIGLEHGKEYTLILDSQAIYSNFSYNKVISQTLTTYPKEKLFNEIVITLDPDLASNRKAKLYHLSENEWKPIEKQPKLLFKDIYGDELKIYILLDNNNDGLWTAGDIEKEIQPEELFLETIKLETKKMGYLMKITQP
ncbi:MAG: Ig-like domain-containing protein, partial [Chitinophagales bacterium]